MWRFALKVLIASPAALAALLLPFGIAYYLQRHENVIPYSISTGIGVGLAIAVFFRIVGEDMRRLDQEYQQRRRREP